MIDAQKNRAYVQIFDHLKPTSEIEILSISDAIDRASKLDEVVICGDVCHKIKTLPDNVKIAPVNMRMPRAVNVALCGRDLLSESKVDNVMDLEPMYIRRSEAEVLWEQRHNN